MLPEFQLEIDAAIEQIAADGSVLDVNENAGRIVGAMRGSGVHIYDEVALGLIKAATRRQVAMTFRNPDA